MHGESESRTRTRGASVLGWLAALGKAYSPQNAMEVLAGGIVQECAFEPLASCLYNTSHHSPRATPVRDDKVVREDQVICACLRCNCAPSDTKASVLFTSTPSMRSCDYEAAIAPAPVPFNLKHRPKQNQRGANVAVATAFSSLVAAGRHHPTNHVCPKGDERDERVVLEGCD